jgi:hypothetical protein
VLPAVTPDRATDFFGLKPLLGSFSPCAAAVCVVSLISRNLLSACWLLLVEPRVRRLFSTKPDDAVIRLHGGARGRCSALPRRL